MVYDCTSFENNGSRWNSRLPSTNKNIKSSIKHIATVAACKRKRTNFIFLITFLHKLTKNMLNPIIEAQSKLNEEWGGYPLLILKHRASSHKWFQTNAAKVGLTWFYFDRLSLGGSRTKLRPWLVQVVFVAGLVTKFYICRPCCYTGYIIYLC